MNDELNQKILQLGHRMVDATNELDSKMKMMMDIIHTQTEKISKLEIEQIEKNHACDKETLVLNISELEATIAHLQSKLNPPKISLSLVKQTPCSYYFDPSGEIDSYKYDYYFEFTNFISTTVLFFDASVPLARARKANTGEFLTNFMKLNYTLADYRYRDNIQCGPNYRRVYLPEIYLKSGIGRSNPFDIVDTISDSKATHKPKNVNLKIYIYHREYKIYVDGFLIKTSESEKKFDSHDKLLCLGVPKDLNMSDVSFNKKIKQTI
jgi:hypothetical protein